MADGAETYLVLARKWRPQAFADVVGQEHVTRTLANAIAAGRIHHAFLFCGPRGIGKTTAARILAKALCCERGPTATPCNECGPCTEITSGRATDVVEMDAASNRTIDDVRSLREAVRYQPARMRRKVYIIDEVHMLTNEAFNALLKTLEEPPPHVTFVLATTDPNKMPVTILSRCQRYDFKLVTTARVAEALGKILEAEKVGVEREALTVLSRESGGSMRDALSLTDQLIAYAGGKTITAQIAADVLGVADRALLSGISRALVARDLEPALRAVEAADARGIDVGQLAKALLGHLRDLSIITQVKDPSGLIEGGEAELAALKADAASAPAGLFPMLFERIAKVCVDLAEPNAALPRAMLELALVDCVHAEPLVPMGDLIDRLEKIEKTGGTGGGGGKQQVTGDRSPETGIRSGIHPRTAPVAPPSATPPSATPPSATPPSATPVAPPATLRPPVSGLPSPVASPPKTGLEAWERVVDFLEKKKAMLASSVHIAQARLEDGKVTLGFPEDAASQAEYVRDADNLAALKAACREILGKDCEIKIEVLRGVFLKGAAPVNGGATSLHQRDLEQKRADKEQREKEAREHPLVQKALDVFGTQVQEIKTDNVE